MTTAMQVQTEEASTNRHENLYIRHRAPVEAAIRAVCRRQRLRYEDAEDFAGHVRLHLIQDDCAVLRRFQGRSSLSTYILAVVTHLGQDWRNARWGKWRPSVEARRQGPIAVHLERLIRRDGLTFDEAFETLRLTFRVTESRAALETIASSLPRPCKRRRFVVDDSLENRPTIDPGPDVLAGAHEAAGAMTVAFRRLARVIAALPPQDALVLKLRYEDGQSVVDIARALGTEVKPLYRRIDRLLQTIRTALEAHGLDLATVRELFLHEGCASLIDHPVAATASYRLFPLGQPHPERAASQSC